MKITYLIALNHMRKNNKELEDITPDKNVLRTGYIVLGIGTLFIILLVVVLAKIL